MDRISDALVGVIAIAVLVLLCVVLVLLFKENKVERVNVDGIECVVARNGLGRVKYVDCDMGGEG